MEDQNLNSFLNQKNSKFLLISGLIGILILATGMVYLTRQNIELRREILSLKNPTPSPIPTLTEKKPSALDGFSIKLPDKWVLRTSVIYDENDEKVGEFSPGKISPIDVPENITCKDIRAIFNHGGGLHTQEVDMVNLSLNETSVDEQYININGNNWYRTLKRGLRPEDATFLWYTANYCLKNKRDNSFFLISFYDRDSARSHTPQWESILSTFKFDE